MDRGITEAIERDYTEAQEQLEGLSDQVLLEAEELRKECRERTSRLRTTRKSS